MVILLIGNIQDGLTFVGPFDSPEKAEEYATQTITRDWQVVLIHKPI